MDNIFGNNVKKLNLLHKIDGPRIGRIMDITADGNVTVDYPGNISGPLSALMTQTVASVLANQSDKIDEPVLLVFENNASNKPIIIDFISYQTDRSHPKPGKIMNNDIVKNIDLNGKRLSFSASDEIVLKCGKSSITLTQAGKVIIRGAYVVSRSSGVNKIKGGSVHIN